MLIDPFARRISYVRLSVTDRCDFRCRYCMSEQMQFLPKSEVLSLEELETLARAFIGLGVRKLRVSGGEPLVRRDIMELFRALGPEVGKGLDELTLTTNGSQLARHAETLAACGVKRVNVSLDSLDARQFELITRRGKLSQVLEGVEAAKQAGLKVKINLVALKGVNEAEWETFVAWCGMEGFDLTFIEVMPLGDIDGEARSDQFVPLTQVRARLAERWTLEPTQERTPGPARYVRIAQTGQRIGFITPLTHNFCEGCNRVRVTCTGELYMCLGQEDKADLRAVLRSGDAGALEEAIRAAIARKPKGHDFDVTRRAPAVSRHMSVTGG